MTNKWGRRLFTAGAVLLLLLGLVHSLSLLEKPIPANDTERQLMDLMAHYRFNLMGSMRSMDNFLRGFSISFMLGVFCVGAIDLVLARERAGLLRRVALVNAIWLAAMTADRPAVFLRSAHIVSCHCAADLCRSVADVAGRREGLERQFMFDRRLEAGHREEGRRSSGPQAENIANSRRLISF